MDVSRLFFHDYPFSLKAHHVSNGGRTHQPAPLGNLLDALPGKRLPQPSKRAFSCVFPCFVAFSPNKWVVLLLKTVFLHLGPRNCKTLHRIALIKIFKLYPPYFFDTLPEGVYQAIVGTQAKSGQLCCYRNREKRQ